MGESQLGGGEQKNGADKKFHPKKISETARFEKFSFAGGDCLCARRLYSHGVKSFEKKSGNPELKKRISELIKFKGGGYNEPEVADIIENALKLLTDVRDTGDARIIRTALRELRYAFRLVRAVCWARAK